MSHVVDEPPSGPPFSQQSQILWFPFDPKVDATFYLERDQNKGPSGGDKSAKTLAKKVERDKQRHDRERIVTAPAVRVPRAPAPERQIDLLDYARRKLAAPCYACNRVEWRTDNGQLKWSHCHPPSVP